MSGSSSALVKRPRDSYSRMVCLGCSKRRIRCELPSGLEIPHQGELRTIQTPCYRCKKLGIPCVVRRTVLGRPSPENGTTNAAFPARRDTSDVVSRIVVELPSRAKSAVPPASGPHGGHHEDALLIRIPQSTETVLLLRALDAIRCEDAEEAWPRHLPVRAGHTKVLDLCIKAVVVACAYARGVPKLSPKHCYQALTVALNAIHANIKRSQEQLSDDILASTALLAPLDGVLKKHDTPSRVHVEGLAAILAARPATFPVTQLARDISDYYVCDSAIMACVRGTPSAFESIARTYFVYNREGFNDSDRVRLKAIGNELLICMPRLVGLVRSLRGMRSLQRQSLLDALRFLKSLLALQDGEAESRLSKRAITRPTSDPDPVSAFYQGLCFASVQDFEALACYWHSRLAILRLEWCLDDLVASIHIPAGSVNEPAVFPWPCPRPRTVIKEEMLRLVKNILMCSEYAKKLRLRKRRRLFAQALVVVWGAKSDVLETLDNDELTEWSSARSDILLQRLNDALAAKPGLTLEDMDTAAGTFIGKRPSGGYVELYSS